MNNTPDTKHFLDTSVVCPILLGSRLHKQYFQNAFGNDSLYTSKYVQMEFKRSHLCKVIDFYFLLDMPSVETIEDAISIWSHKFKSSQLKAILLLISALIDSHTLGREDSKDKEKALRAIGRYTKRLELKLRRKFKTIGVNTTRCRRATVRFKPRNGPDISETFRDFLDEFNDVKQCRKLCSIDRFFLKRYVLEINALIKYGAGLPSPKKPENKGFLKIVQVLQDIGQGKINCTCHRCEAIGDAVIALEAPRNMQLEHTDHSFDHLCPPLGQPHSKHPSELRLLAESATSPASIS